MTSITTKLVKDGNSVAVRIPKTALIMSGLHGEVKMDITQGQIILSSLDTTRGDWKVRIADVISSNPNALALDPELADWDETISDGLDGKY